MWRERRYLLRIWGGPQKRDGCGIVGGGWLELEGVDLGGLGNLRCNVNVAQVRG